MAKKQSYGWIRFVVLTALITLVANYFNIWTDDSDGDGWHRSGVSIVTDHATGMQYLKTWTGGITPRMNADGTQRAISPRKAG